MRIINNKLLGPSLLLIGQYVNQVVGPLVNLLVINYLGSQTFGLYASAIAVTSLLIVFPDFGIQQSVLNILSKKKEDQISILSIAFSLAFIFSTITYVIVIFWFNLLNYNNVTTSIAMVTGLTFFRVGLMGVLTAHFQAKYKYERLAVINFILSISQWVSTLLGIILKVDLLTLVALPVGVSTCLLFIFIFKERAELGLIFGEENSRVNIKQTGKKILDNSWRFGLGSSLHQFYHKSDAVILSLVRTPFEVGQYVVAFRVMELIYFFPGVLFNQVLFPKYFVWAKENHERLKVYYYLMCKLMLVLGITFATFVTLFGHLIIIKLLDNSSELAISLLYTMSFAIPLRFLASSVGAILTTSGQINLKIKLQFLIAMFSISLNSIFVPLYGAKAGAIIMVGTELLLLLLFYLGVHKFNGEFKHFKPTFKDMVCIPLIIFVSALLYYFFIDTTFILRVISAFIYLLLIFIIMILYLSKEQKKEIKSLLGIKNRQ